jgi:hypothetical protein
MNFITEKYRWHERIFDDHAATAWAREVNVRNKLAGKKAWPWCLTELWDKATQYRQGCFARVFDTGSYVCKSRELVPLSVAGDLKSSLASSFATRLPKRALFTIVDPKLLPLAYKKTSAQESGGSVKLSDFTTHDMQYLVDSIRNEKQGVYRDNDLDHDDYEVSNGYDFDSFEEHSSNEDGRLRDENTYSFKYQRLPSDLELGGPGTDVCITSYVNNAKPNNRLFFENVEKLVSYSIPMWNCCLFNATETRSDG